MGSESKQPPVSFEYGTGENDRGAAESRWDFPWGLKEDFPGGKGWPMMEGTGHRTHGSRGFWGFLSPWEIKSSENSLAFLGEQVPGSGRICRSCVPSWPTVDPFTDPQEKGARGAARLHQLGMPLYRLCAVLSWGSGNDPNGTGSCARPSRAPATPLRPPFSNESPGPLSLPAEQL
ncbi:uncharacterized protein LOC144376125 [Ictidomys tridecemlineatus]